MEAMNLFTVRPKVKRALTVEEQYLCYGCYSDLGDLIEAMLKQSRAREFVIKMYEGERGQGGLCVLGKFIEQNIVSRKSFE